ncbi:hypothetical protein K490DRAFT_66713 [Saccharata proteae CBS 121410]|uniref:Uncharacterized protein n=1 Tax=Saccharata proteae CBS 121410 TaxID=1314787 RepID=A0A9P4LUH3_9PEZI|nr:hypothetical protein K490DRAFT_66713 [Saccharata proteae CBS 121410]
MKSFAAAALSGLSFLSAVSAFPTVNVDVGLPDGFQPITRVEIQQRLASNATEADRIFVCTGEEFYGTCGMKVVDFDQCTTLDAPFYHNVGSFSPGNGGYCRITTSANSCTQEGDLFIEPPGVNNLRWYEDVNWGSNITSFECQNCEACQLKRRV